MSRRWRATALSGGSFRGRAATVLCEFSAPAGSTHGTA